MKFTEFIKDYVKKHPGVKYKDAIKDKKVRCLWHDHRGKEIGCPSTCPPVPQERAQFTTLPRPASIDTPQPIRQYTPPARQPPILGRTRNDPPQQQQGHVTADGFPISQVASAINRSYRTRSPQGQSFLSGLINTVGENLANALQGAYEAIPADRGILGPNEDESTEDESTEDESLSYSALYQNNQAPEFQTVINPDRNISVQRARERFDPEERASLSQAYRIGQGAMLMVNRQYPFSDLTEAQYVENVVNEINNIMYSLDQKERSQFVRGANSVFKEQNLGNLRFRQSSGEVYHGAGLRKKKSRKYI